MRITKQRRAFINACKEDFNKFKNPHQVAVFYMKRHEIFEGCDPIVIPLVEIAVNEFIDEKGWRLEVALEISLSKIKEDK